MLPNTEPDTDSDLVLFCPSIHPYALKVANLRPSGCHKIRMLYNNSFKKKWID